MPRHAVFSRMAALITAIVMSSGSGAFAGEPDCSSGQDCAEKGIAIGRAGDFVTAEPLLRKACDLDNALGCYKLGVMYWNGNGIERSIPEALTGMEKGCRLRDAEACQSLGDLYLMGDQEIRDTPRAATFYSSACDLGSGAACLSMGRLAGQGALGQEGREQEAQYYEKSCKLDYGMGCVNLGYLYAEGIGFPGLNSCMTRAAAWEPGRAATISG